MRFEDTILKNVDYGLLVILESIESIGLATKLYNTNIVMI